MIKTHIINSTTAEYTDAELSFFQTAVLTAGYFGTQTGDRTATVVQKTVPAMGVDIQAGKLLVPFTKASIEWKIVCEIVSEALVISPNSSGVNRVDAVIIKCDTTLDPNTLKSNIASAVVIQGSGITPLSDVAIQTAIGANFTFIRLANIYVPNGATSILDADISNVLPKVKITPAVDVDGGAIVYGGSSVSGDFINELAVATIPALSPVSVKRTEQYQTNESIYGNGEVVVGLPGGSNVGGILNPRQGIYTLFGYDWVFFLVNGVIHYSRKLSNTSGSWSARVSLGISVQDQDNRNWTMGCDEVTSRFFFAYAKNAGVNDGKVYHIMAQASAGGLVVSSEVIAYTSATWKMVVSSTRTTIDSEFINGVYYVVFQNKNVSNYKATVIGTSTINGTWTNAIGVPTDIDSDYADFRHGQGVAIGGIGKDKVGVICLRITAGSPYHNNFCIYKEFDIINSSWSSVETVKNLGQNNPSYDTDMQRVASVSFLDKRPVVMFNKATSGSYGEDYTNIIKRTSSGSWVGIGATSSGFDFCGSLMTNGSKLFDGMQVTDGGGSQLFNTPYMNYSSDGFECRWNRSIAGSYQDNIFADRGSSSNQFYVVSWTRGAQKGDGTQNAFGFMYTDGYGNQNLSVNYIKIYELSTTINNTDFTSSISRDDFEGFAKTLIGNGSTGSVQVSGLMDGFSGLIKGKKCWISSGGVTQYETQNSIYIGIAKSTTSIELDIDNSEKFLSPQFSSTMISTPVEIDYNGVVEYIIRDQSGSGGNNREVYRSVVAGEIVDLTAIAYTLPFKFKRLN